MSDVPSQSTPATSAPSKSERVETPRANPAVNPHGERTRIGLGRQVLMGLLLFLLTGVITIYWFVTDAPRVQAMAEQALSQLLGGNVKVSKAHLSIFGGLRLDDVAVYVDDDELPDSKIFTAKTFLVKTDPAALLGGRLEPTQILALDPHVRLCENLDTGKWNYHRLSRKKQDTEKPKKDQKPLVLPEMLLRAGVLEYARIERGVYEGGRTMAIDGLVMPTPGKSDQYRFDFESRAPGQPVGPTLRGFLDLQERSVSARLQDVAFSETIRVMLPSQVQQWWMSHQLSGKISVPHLEYRAAKDGKPADFQIEIDVDDVSLAIRPEELMTRREWEQVRLYRPGFMPAGMADFGLVGRADFVHRVVQPQPIALKHVSGSFVFTPDEIWFSGVRGIRGRLENNLFQLRGRVGGYSLDAPIDVSLIGSDVVMPALPRYLGAIPSAARKVYDRLRPEGRARFAVDVRRDSANTKLKVQGRVDVLDGAFQFDEFPYPLRHVTGAIVFGPDKETGEDRVDMIGLRGYGAAGTKNAQKVVSVDGWISPIDRGSGVSVRVRSEDAHLDPYLRQAIPPEAREAIALFDVKNADGTSKSVEMQGSFDTNVSRAKGRKKKVYVDVDLNIESANGTFEYFKYPMKDAKGLVQVRDSYVDIKGFTTRNGDASLTVDGRVMFGKNRPVEPVLTVSAKKVPLDEDFLKALPETERAWIKKLGVGGLLDINGKVFLPDRVGVKSEDVDFDLGVKLSDGWIWPVKAAGPTTKPVFGQFGLAQVAADLRVSRSKMHLARVEAKRGEADVLGSGDIDWSGPETVTRLQGVGTGVKLDPTFYEIVPKTAQKAWDQLRPEGAIDVGFAYASTGKEDDYKIVLHPGKSGVAITPTWFPWRMEKLGGEVVVDKRQVALNGITARHKESTVKIDGTGPEPGAPGWNLKLSGEQIVLDEELRKAVPEGLGDFFDAMKLQGAFSFETPRLWYGEVDAQGNMIPAGTRTEVLSADASASASGSASAPKKGVQEEYNFDAKLKLHGGSMDLGIPVTDVLGGADFSMIVRDGELYWMKGKVEAASMKMAGRTVTNFESPIVKPKGVGLYQFAQIRGRLAGGTIGGQVDLGVPKSGSSQYGLNIILKDADIREIAGEEGKEIRGRMSASLNMAGNWDDASKRRGRGDVRVQGRELYRVPVVLGLLQITNLSLPIKSPFRQGSASYSIQGHKVMFENIELLADNMIMSGGGWLDFATRKVEMKFETDNPNWPKIPLLDDLLQGAKRELFVIKVRGTIEEPQVGGKMMNTFTTTVDEVMKGDGKKK